MKIINKLNEIVKELEGNIIGIGIQDEKILNSISKNNNILECNLLDSISKEKRESGKNKKIKISKLRKKFKKKKTDYIICNIDAVNKFVKKFIPDSIYLNKKYVYLYNFNSSNIEKIKKYYSRYSNNIEQINCSDGIILKVETNCNTNKIKEFGFEIVNFISDILDYITELLLS